LKKKKEQRKKKKEKEKRKKEKKKEKRKREVMVETGKRVLPLPLTIGRLVLKEIGEVKASDKVLFSYFIFKFSLNFK